jgi:hypothetical protein
VYWLSKGPISRLPATWSERPSATSRPQPFSLNCIGTAQQYQIPVDHNGWFSLSWCHFNAARTRTMLGWGVGGHLSQAHSALNMAINLNPSYGPYHAAMGMLLAVEGQLLLATQAFSTAVRLNPADAFSQYMLAILNQAQGNVAAGELYFAGAQQYAPSLPPLERTLQAHGDRDKGFDWNALVSTVGKGFELFTKLSSSPSGESSPGFLGGGGWDFGGGGTSAVAPAGRHDTEPTTSAV